MSPEKIRDFEAEWPLLARRLKLFLGRKKVPASQVEDLIQETALRLYKMWDSVDRSRPTWALTVTIALNLLRDEYRKAGHADIVSDLPDIPHSCDVERAGMARIELGRVRDALARMTPAHRSVLLAEVGYGVLAVEPAGDKMRRMRARRKLTQLLEQVSAIFVLPARKVSDAIQGMLGLRDGLVAGTSCLLCAVLGTGIAATVPFMPGRAEAHSTSRVASAAQQAWAAVEAGSRVLVADASSTATRAGSSTTSGTRATRKAGSRATSQTAPSALPQLPGSTSDDPGVPEVDPNGVTVPEPPEPPAPGPAPVPAPPAPPSVPGTNPSDSDDLEQTVTQLTSKARAALDN
jgi:DNA-directed RNA polymerase specialized sigma24 family protein